MKKRVQFMPVEQSAAAWNGEYYVTFGSDEEWQPTIWWKDARRYGFICAGGDSRFSNPLKHLSCGNRIWVYIPKKGYVGVGRVAEKRQRVTAFQVKTGNGLRPVLDVLTLADELRSDAEDPHKAEYFVRVQWLDTKPVSEAAREKGFFASRHIVCKPTAQKWRDTVEQLKISFPNWQGR